MEVGKILKQLRKSAGLTQEELATRLSMTQANISSMESNRSQPSHVVVQSIAKYFKVSTAYIYINSVTIDDVPENKKELYKTLFPIILELSKKLI